MKLGEGISLRVLYDEVVVIRFLLDGYIEDGRARVDATVV